MIPKEILQAHYKEYSEQSDTWVKNMELTKKSIVQHVLNETKFNRSKKQVKIAVLGASDKRYLPIHQRIFETLLKKQIIMTTLDIDEVHLGKQKNVLEHNVTKPFPNTPYDLIFSHELMKFLTQEEQVKMLYNSFLALNKAGLAMHILHAPSLKGTKELKPWQHRVDLSFLLKKLKEEKIPVKKIVFQSESNVDWLCETTVLLIQKH